MSKSAAAFRFCFEHAISEDDMLALVKKRGWEVFRRTRFSSYVCDVPAGAETFTIRDTHIGTYNEALGVFFTDLPLSELALPARAA